MMENKQKEAWEISMEKIKISPKSRTTIISNFKSNWQFYSIYLHKSSIIVFNFLFNRRHQNHMLCYSFIGGGGKKFHNICTWSGLCPCHPHFDGGETDRAADVTVQARDVPAPILFVSVSKLEPQQHLNSSGDSNKSHWGGSGNGIKTNGRVVWVLWTRMGLC